MIKNQKNQNTSAHPDAIGSGSLTALIPRRVDIATFGTDADALDCLWITFSPEIFPDGTPAVTPHAATVAVTTDGATGSYASISLVVKTLTAAGADAGDVTFTIDLDAGLTDWASGTCTCESLKEIIDKINEDDAGGTSGKLLRGFNASIGPGGMYDLYVRGTALMWQTEAAEYILPPGTMGTPTGFLKRDMAVHTLDSDFFLYWRLTSADGREADRDQFKLLDLYGVIGTTTGCTVYVVPDDEADYVLPVNTWATDIANHDEIWSVTAAALSAVPGAAAGLQHNPRDAAPSRGPMVVIVKGDTDAAQTANLKVIMQAVS